MKVAQLEPLVRHLRGLVEAQATRDLSDAQLLDQFATGRDEAAFAALMHRHGGLVWHVCRHVLHQEQDAEDAFQASFLVLALKAASLRRGQGLGNWLHGVAYRVAMNARRKAMRRQSHERRKAAATLRAVPGAEALHELQTLLHEEINRLPAKYRVPLVLCGLEGKSKSDAAKELSWKEGTVSGRLARARKMLEARLARWGVMLSAAWAATTLNAEVGAALIPSALVWATTDAALHLAAGKPLTAQIVSSRVAALMKGALKAMSLTKLKLALTFVLGLGLLGVGAGMAAYEAFTNEPTPDSREFQASDDKRAPEASQPRLDLFGDPLPAGAVARLGTLRFRQNDIEIMALSTDGRVLITKSCEGGSICAWEADSGKILWKTQPGPRWGVNRGNGLLTASFSPDGRLLAEVFDCRPANGMAECIFLCDAKDGKVLHRFPPDGGFEAVWEAVFSPDTKVIAANIEGTVYLWSTETGRQIAKCVGAAAPRATIRFSADGKTLISALRGKVSHWDVAKRANTSVVEPKVKDAFWCQAISDDGRLLAVAAGLTGEIPKLGPPPTSTLQLFDTATGKECCQFQGETIGIQALILSRDGRTLIGVSPQKDHRLSTISVWDTRSGRRKHRFPLRVSSDYHLGVTPDGRKLFTSISSNHGWLAHGPGESVVRWWDAATGNELMTQPAHEDRVESLCFTPDGRFLLSSAHDDTMRVWDLDAARSLHRVPPEGRYFRALSVVSPQGTFLAGGGDDKLHLYNWITGRRLQSFVPPPEPDNVPAIMQAFNHVRAFVVSPDGHSAVSLRDYSRGLSGGAESFFDFWDLAARKIRKSSAMPRGVRFSHFHPDGKRFIGFLFAGDWDSADVVVVDIESGRIEAALQHADRRWMNTATAPDGRTLVTATTHAWKWDGGWIGIAPHAIHVWELSSTKECMTITLKENGSDDRCDRVAIAPDCRTIVTVSHRSALRFWDMITGEELLRRTGATARVTSLAFSADRRFLATGHADSTILLWDMSSVGEHYKSLLTKVDARQVAGSWEDLASSDAGIARQAIGRLIAASDSATALLRTKLVAAPEITEERISSLVADLDHDSFVRREKASKELEKLLPQVRPALVNALATTPSLEVRRRIKSLLALPSLVVRDAETLRDIRALQVLEHIAATGSDETRLSAIDLLKNVSAGSPEARLTQEAKATVERVVKRATAKPWDRSTTFAILCIFSLHYWLGRKRRDG
jgi:RNA polymerase sigma factor (sigma-70 family)